MVISPTSLFYWYSVRAENVLKEGINKLLSVLTTSLTTEAVLSYGGVDPLCEVTFYMWVLTALPVHIKRLLGSNERTTASTRF